MTSIAKQVIFCLTAFLAMHTISCRNENNSKDIVFKGETKYNDLSKSLRLSEELAREILIDWIKQNEIKYSPFPREIVAVYNNGYFFINGDFKINIQYEGYFVDEHGKVSKLKIPGSIRVKDYHDRVGRDSW